MELNINLKDLRKRSLFLATPMYGGACAGVYAKSLADLCAMCAIYQIHIQLYLLFNESLIPRARNYCCDSFMQAKDQAGNPVTHMIFLDADIGFNPQDVVAMLAMQSDESDYDVLTAPYPKKCISWEKIKAAVDQGKADDNPNDLEKYVGDFVVNPKAGHNEIGLNDPVEILEAGTGFMMIRRRTFEKFKEAFPQYAYKPDHVRTKEFDGSRDIMMYFQSDIDPETRRYLSEDYWFSHRLADIGLKTWFCPWMRTQHVGSYVFGGTLADLASIGVAATADPTKLVHR